jgi:hypothetical protein
MKLTNKDIIRFWSNIDILGVDECWPYKLNACNNGYANFQLTILERSKVLAHRVAWTTTYGNIPNDKLVLHKCDNRRCCNPNHLYIGTHSDNNLDAYARNRRVVIPERHARNKAKLYECEVWLIRKLLSSRIISQTKIAKMFRVSQATISNIHNNSKWFCKEGNYA